ncbi:alpha/beta hydrolase [Frankia sp. AgB1.9]|uniref:alpha/beta fold hydrolase n=1 Tax=unclassified Frankia TaxID=2632575 RepID=UPI0019337A51|nr:MULTISPECIES: alpha/beta hydrolase [unclassified Frankia]MBL7488948.1 alpha/beta hydrolase [Frankia sp. AgW1.1]MBL7553191.1 alpha/beta hydrolase [Frankia sp. AgB1.9]MBL7625315.1 alpha/beta hydrolase [Frankia sp. AgB1.8]
MDGTGQVDGTAGTAVTDRWVDVDGPVYYADFGGPADGPLIVCVHGLGASHTSWWTFGPLLARHGRVLALDLAGFGRTVAGGRRTDVESNRRLLAGFLAAVAGERPALLVGNSMGGMISVLQAAADPRSVAGLVLVSPALPIPRLRPPDASILGMFAGMALPKVGSMVLARRREVYTAEQLVEQALIRTTVDARRVPADAFAAMVALSKERAELPGGGAGSDAALVTATRSVVGRLARPRDLAAAVAAVTAPTLLVHGRQDRLVPVAAARHAARRRPDWRCEILDDCGHLAQLEAPDQTIALVEDWLEGVGAEALRPDPAAIPAQQATAS